MWIIHEPKKVALWNKRHFEEKNGECAAFLKYSVLIFVENIYKMQRLERSVTPVRYIGRTVLKPLNTELNSICHLLVLLRDLTFMGPCIVSIFQYTCISNKMHCYSVHLYLEIAPHVSGGTSTHHRERIQLHLQHIVFVTPLLLSAAIVEIPPETCRAVSRYK
jgi:hypothetical protein